MCGILGYYLDAPYEAGSLTPLLAKANLAQRHRGPDSDNNWVSSDQRVAFAHRRLSVIDLSSDANQPMHDDATGNVVVFNGEIYNFQALRSELRSMGITFKTHSDTEVILAAYRQWGDQAISRLNGMFAIAIWNSREKSLLLARDRLGVKPLFFFQIGTRFAFASTLRSLMILSSDLRAPEPDKSAVGELIEFGWISAQRSALSGIQKVPPGAFMKILSDGTSSTTVYWDATRHPAPSYQGGEADYLEELDSLLSDSVKLRLQSDVPVGLFLSGGIDSSLIAALVAETGNTNLSSFTIGFEDQNYNESSHAKAISNALGLEHSEIQFSEAEMQQELEKMLDCMDEPSADLAMLPTALLSRSARKRVTVALTGDGGDELFLGYPLHAAMQKYASLHSMPRAMRNFLARLLLLLPGKRFELLGGFLKQDNLASQYLYLRKQLRTQKLDGSDSALDLLKKSEAELAGLEPADIAARWDMDLYLPDALLIKTDLASMRWSLEAREPLLDYRLAELALQAPVDWRIGKKPLKKLLKRRLPESLWARPKHAFSVPIAAWMRGNLAYLLEELAEPDSLLDSIVSIGSRRALISAHTEERADNSNALWAMVVAKRWNDSLGRNCTNRLFDEV